ncbi:MAG: Fic family protein [Vulcanimicrobiaceae bacterium]
MGMYIWQRSEWPNFTWNKEAVAEPIAEARLKQGQLAGAVEHLGFAQRDMARLETLTTDAVETSQIEGETLSRVAVRASVARRLGIREAGVRTVDEDARAEGIVAVTLDATRNYAQSLTAERLLQWHRDLLDFDPHVAVGKWRSDSHGPMQVLTMRHGRAPIVHFEAPPAQRVPAEIDSFLLWFDGQPRENGILRSALAHLWFVTIHPFEDGNGRISRAIADMALARDENSPSRFFSVSRQIRIDQNAYYKMLERTQRGSLDVTEWLLWFLDCYARAIDFAREQLSKALRATRFWSTYSHVDFSERQRKVLQRVLGDFEGNLTTRMWRGITKVSEPTAQRDIADLVAKGVLVKNPGGSKNTNYSLAGSS